MTTTPTTEPYIVPAPAHDLSPVTALSSGTRYALSSVLVAPGASNSIIAATDGRMLAVAPLPNGCGPRALIPGDAFGRFTRASAKPRSSASLIISDGRYTLTTPGKRNCPPVTESDALPDGTFPPYADVVPSDPSATVATVTLSAALLHTLARAITPLGSDDADQLPVTIHIPANPRKPLVVTAERGPALGVLMPYVPVGLDASAKNATPSKRRATHLAHAQTRHHAALAACGIPVTGPAAPPSPELAPTPSTASA